MLITVLSVPDCPNTSLMIERLGRALGRPHPAHVVVVRNEAEATAWGVCGSPTLLVDGIDPFPLVDAPPSLSCRLYAGPDGGLSGAPSVEQLRQALAAEPAARASATSAWLDPIGRAGQGRLAPSEGGLRGVQQTVLLALASSGSLPSAERLDRAASDYDRSGREVIGELAEQDFLCLDEDYRVRAAYPFSLVPTRHQVAIRGGPTVWSMCAIDALGIGAMLRQPVTITSSDPVSGEKICVEMSSPAARWNPASALVFAGGRTESGPAASVCCDAINFFVSAHTAARWAALHPEVAGVVLGLAEAGGLGRTIFGALLDDAPSLS